MGGDAANAGAKRLGARRPGAALGSRRPPAVGSHSKAGGRRPDAVDSKKQTLGVGALVLPPTSRVWGFPPRFEVQTSMRSREAWTEPKKKDGEMVPQVSPIELSPNREALEPHDPSREHPDVERVPEVTPHRVQPHGGTSGDHLPDRTDHEGEVLSPEYRVRIECDCPLGSCLCPRRPSNQA